MSAPDRPLAFGRYLLTRGVVAMAALIATLWAAGVKLPEQPVVLAALIAVGGVMATQITNLTLNAMQADSRRRDDDIARDARRREEAEAANCRLRNALEALEAALGIEIRNLRYSFDPARNGPSLAAYRDIVETADAGEGSFPATVASDGNVIFDLTRPDLLVLPGVVSGTLAQYRMLDGALTAAIAAMGGGLYDKVSPARKKQALVNYHLLGEETLAVALVAQALVRSYRLTLTPPSFLGARRVLSIRERKLLVRLLRRRASRARLEGALGVKTPHA